ncbi:uncharacterized protein LOC110376805 isoform X1 [Helicoverpa armigera]|uniref:uncharacterized protein LOC110376805 isoform X1 n=1 Tax=Helicoverpa armigera TaxID=29058 RepID=UPI003083095B
MDYTTFVIIFIVCIDHGDGHWKERDKEKLRHDIELYKTMAEKIEREIESFYDEYPEERYKGDNVDRIHYKRVTNILDRKKETGNDEHNDKVEQNFLYANASDVTNNMPSKHSINQHDNVKFEILNKDKPNKPSALNSPWPKFEDILLAMGRKYDWKNDRWIKVKEKLKIANNEEEMIARGDNNSIEYHEKHKFSYRIVKLNKSKSRRNVVVAVSAVR